MNDAILPNINVGGTPQPRWIVEWVSDQGTTYEGTAVRMGGQIQITRAGSDTTARAPADATKEPLTFEPGHARFFAGLLLIPLVFMAIENSDRDLLVAALCLYAGVGLGTESRAMTRVGLALFVFAVSALVWPTLLPGFD